MRKNEMFYRVREALTLTTSYVAGTTITEANQFNQCRLLVQYVQGSATSLEVRVRYSYDGATFYQDVNITPTAALNTLEASVYTYTGGDFDFQIDFPFSATDIEVSVKGTGTMTSSSCAVQAILAYV